MQTTRLIRLETSPSGTFGVFIIDNQICCFTLEPPKKGNERNISCIPTGQYLCKPYLSEKFERMCIGLFNVHNRDYISMHPGNIVPDSIGCILPGMEIGHLSGRRAVLKSNKALDKIIASVGNVFMITVVENF